MLQQLQLIFWDVKKVYKNFVHWNIAKIITFFVVFFYSFLLSVLFFFFFITPFYIDNNIMVIIWWVFALFFLVLFWIFLLPFFAIQVLINPQDLIQMILSPDSTVFVSLSLQNHFYGIFYIVFFVFFTILWFLKMSQLNYSYIQNEKYSFLSLLKPDFKKYFSLIPIFMYNFILLTIPFFIFWWIFFIVYMYYGTVFLNPSVFITFQILFVLLIVFYFFFAYKIIFSFFLALFTPKTFSKKIDFLKASFRMTKNNFLLFLIWFLLIIFGILTLYYIFYLWKNIPWVSYGYVFIYFFFFSWLLEMYLMSFYKHISQNDFIDKKQEEIKDDTNEIL